MSRTIGKQELADIATGATFLSSAGGGSLESGLRMIDENLPEGGEITIISVEEALADDKLTIATEYYGSPFQGVSVSSVGGVLHAVRAYMSLVEGAGGEVGHLVPIECGVQSTFVPVPLVAYELGLPVVDADGAGRAVPGLTNYTTYSDLPVTPTILANISGSQSLMIGDVPNAEALDELMSGAVGAKGFSGIGGFVPFALDSETLGEVTKLRGSFRLAEDIGKTLRTSYDPVTDLLALMGNNGRKAHVIFRGEIVEYVPVGRPLHSEGSEYVPPFGSVTLRNDHGDLVLINQSENLIAWSSGGSAPVAMAPDGICYVTPDGKTFTNLDKEARQKGLEVVVVGVEATALRANQEALDSFTRCLRTICAYAGPNIPLSEIWG